MDRYSRQILFEPIGETGQIRLGRARVALIGCGALGSALADTLVRAGVGTVRIVDRDFVELNNLQRQVLFDEADVAAGLPKAVAAQRHLEAINSTVTIEGIVEDVHAGNIAALVAGADVVLDGTDNFDTRYLINDLSIRDQRPWVYGACVSATGLVMPIIPGRTPCLRCLFDTPPPAGVSPTCDTAGVIAPIVQWVAALQAVAAMQILIGRSDDVAARLTQIDAWTGRTTALDVQQAAARGCPCCRDRRFEYLEGGKGQRAARLCGRDAVQVHPSGDTPIDLPGLAARWADVADAPPRVNAFLVQARIGGKHYSVFANGRAIIQGVAQIEEARTLYARYVGG